VLRRIVGGLETPALVRFLVRMAIAVAAGTGAAWLVSRSVDALTDDAPSFPAAVLTVGVVTLADAAVFLAVARLLRIHEVTAVLDTVLGSVLGRAKRRTRTG
jgi:putative peptidoglycan lipid II flippase